MDDTKDTDAFEIDEMTGLITTAEVLDREAKDMYNIILEVADNGQPKQSVTRILHIKVLDVDDHKPRFAREVVSNETYFPHSSTFHCVVLFVGRSAFGI